APGRVLEGDEPPGFGTAPCCFQVREPMIRILLQVGSSSLLREFADEAITIGRASTNHLVIGEPRVSRLHARLETTEDGVQVVDLKSGNGTRLNGERIA